jgi:hypothetical protein
MNADATPRRRRQRGGGGACDGAGQGRGKGRAGTGGQSSLGSRTATRALIAAGTYVAQDLRDRDGVTRPLLRRAALRMVGSPMKTIRGIGTAYLRGDPPTSGELEEGREKARLHLLPGEAAEAPEDAVWEADDASSPV